MTRASTNLNTEDKKLITLADEYLQFIYDTQPELTTLLKIENSKNDEFDDHSLNSVYTQQKYENKLLTDINYIDIKQLSFETRVTYYIIKEYLESSILNRKCHLELWGMCTYSPWFSNLAHLANVQPVDTQLDRQDALKRWKGFSQVADDEISKLKKGLEEGYTIPKAVIPRVIKQLNTILDTDIKSSPFYIPGYTNAQSTIKPDQEFQEQFYNIVKNIVNPALNKFKDFLEQDYMPNARDGLGVSNLDDGIECYKSMVRKHASVTLEPSKIQEYGFKAIESLSAKLQEISNNHFNGIPYHELMALAKTKTMHFASEQDFLDYNYRALERAKEVLPQWISETPKHDLNIKPYPEFLAASGVAGEYHPPSRDGSREGIYYINAHNYQKKAYADLESTLFHEGIPGHHLQFAYIQNHTNLHPIAELLYSSGQIEGWALYAEQLAYEFDLYSDPFAKVGYISNALMRAVRLVVDPGLHVFNMSREEAYEYFHKYTTFDDSIIYSEIDRYITLGGQATGYYLGLLEILEAREYVKKELGANFSLVKFHDHLLSMGPVPLEYMVQEIKEWVKKSQVIG